jgi:pimeloyl-ACP methyl ester carboxylesterase
MLDRLRDAGDVLVMDYRGSGRSRPRLTCSDSSAPPSLPPRALLAVRDTALAHFTREARACARRLRAAGTDLQGYTWSEVAHDVESLRRALGVPRLALVGFSSGTHAALAALRLHESLASRVVLIGTEGPDHTRKLPSQLDRQMARIDSMIRADSAMRTEIPDFTGLVRTVLRSLERQPAQVTVRLPGGPVDVAVGAFALQYITTRSLSGPEEFDLLPRLYLATSRGDLRPLTRIVERLMRPNPPDPLDFIFDAASGVSAARWKAIEREATTALLGPAANFPFPDIGPAWGVRDLGSEFRSPIRTRIPTLFVTGSFDANTPPSNVEEIRRGFAHHWSVIVENAGHTGAFGAPATADVVLAFLRGDAPASTRIQVGPPRLTLPSR